MQEILNHPHLQYLNQSFKDAKRELRLVGGCVRDIMLDQTPKDIDLCTDATPDEMKTIAMDNGINVIPTGLQHGTLTFVIEGTPYEITTLRIDIETDGRHAEVAFTRSFEEDAARRDLTINAMSMDFAGNVFDYFGGSIDLQRNIILFVGDAETRIREDYLRILRYFRFAARFGSCMDSETLDIIENTCMGLDQISRERVWMEMTKLFTYKGAYDVLRVMEDRGVLAAIGLPELTSAYASADSPEAYVASFFYKDPIRVRNFCNSWKMSAAETDQICWIAHTAHYPINEADVRAFINLDNVSPAWIVSAIQLLYGKSNLGLADYTHTYQRVVFPIKGQDLLNLGMKPGKWIGQVLSMMQDTWRSSNYTLTKEKLLEMIKV